MGEVARRLLLFYATLVSLVRTFSLDRPEDGIELVYDDVVDFSDVTWCPFYRGRHFLHDGFDFGPLSVPMWVSSQKSPTEENKNLKRPVLRQQ